jgi:hypothetical protein
MVIGMGSEGTSSVTSCRRLCSVLIPVCVLAGCAMAASPSELDSVKRGLWGGPHISMTVAEASTEIEFDCGRATVPGTIETDRDGGFTATGTFLQERPGPTTPDGPRQRPMRLSGTVKGDEMQVAILLTDSNEDVGSFALTFGTTARLVKCK